jgi:hypothetical protein
MTAASTWEPNDHDAAKKSHGRKGVVAASSAYEPPTFNRELWTES